MSQSKIGNTFELRAAAFLKFNPKNMLMDINFSEFRYNIKPNKIKEEVSYFNKKISFDILIRGDKLDFYCECKYTSKNNIYISSTEFKEALLEFIAVEKFRKFQPNEENIYYIFISNVNLKNLRKEIINLKLAEEGKLYHYYSSLKSTAKNKWNIDIKKYYNSNIIRNVLERIYCIEINQIDLNHVVNDDKYIKIYNELLSQIPENEMDVYDIFKKYEESVKILSNMDEQKIRNVYRKYRIEFSKNFINEIVNNDLGYVEDIIEIHKKNFFKKDYQIKHNLSLTNFDAYHIIIKEINKILTKLNYDYIFIYDYNFSYVYLINPNWSRNLLSFKTEEGNYDIEKIMENISIELSSNTLKVMLNETSRKIFRITIDYQKFV